jgi:hypothetical protein
MSCPYLKEVVMLYCDACLLKKMLPLDRLVSATPCLAEDFRQCPLFRDAAFGGGEPRAVAERAVPAFSSARRSS